MKLRTAIVEDQKPDAERLEQLLKKAAIIRRLKEDYRS